MEINILTISLTQAGRNWKLNIKYDRDVVRKLWAGQ